MQRRCAEDCPHQRIVPSRTSSSVAQHQYALKTLKQRPGGSCPAVAFARPTCAYELVSQCCSTHAIVAAPASLACQEPSTSTCQVATSRHWQLRSGTGSGLGRATQSQARFSSAAEQSSGSAITFHPVLTRPRCACLLITQPCHCPAEPPLAASCWSAAYDS